jgi:hypothetical protein
MWSVIGLVLMALGVGGALVSLGYMPGTDRDVTLWTRAMSDRWHTWGIWAPVVVAGAGLVVAVGGFALIAAELRRRGGRNVAGMVFTEPDVARAPGGDEREPAVAGKTSVSGSTLRHALQRDLQSDPRIAHATVRMTGRPGRPRLHLRLDLTRGSNLSDVQAHVAGAIARFRITSSLDPTVRETVVNLP